MSSFALKIIAITTMFIDHVGAVLNVAYGIFAFRVIGRVAFPIYVFLVAQGCRHTKDMKKYMSRLFMFGLISEIPYDLLFTAVENPGNSGLGGLVFFNPHMQNVMFTLFLGVLAVYVYNSISWENPFLLNLAKVGAIGAIILSGDILHTDYGSIGVLAILLCYILKSRIQQIIMLFAMLLALYFWPGISQSYALIFGGCCSLVFIYFYNGSQGRKLKQFFYWFYPAHIALILIGSLFIFY